MNAGERVERLVMSWVFWYTRRLPAGARRMRCSELRSDLWEQRHDAAERGVSELVVAASICRRVIAGMPADLSWRLGQLAAAQGRSVDHRVLREEAAATMAPAAQSWIRQRVRTRKCKACGNFYARRLPNCPVCKIRPGYDGIERDPRWFEAVGRGGSNWSGGM